MFRADPYCFFVKLDEDSLCKVIDSATAMSKLRTVFETQEVSSASSVPITFVIEE